MIIRMGLRFKIVQNKINTYLRAVLAGVLPDVSMCERTVTQQKCAGAVGAVTELAVKCRCRLPVRLNLMAVETERKNTFY